MLRRLAALAVLFALLAGVCPEMTLFAEPGRHACCQPDDSCASLRRAMTCCSADPGLPEAPSPATPTHKFATSSVEAGQSGHSAATVNAWSATVPPDTRGHQSVPPLLRSCVTRI